MRMETRMFQHQPVKKNNSTRPAPPGDGDAEDALEFVHVAGAAAVGAAADISGVGATAAGV